MAKPHKNATLELVEAINERPEILQVRKIGDLKVQVVKGDWAVTVGYNGRDLSDRYMLNRYRDAFKLGDNRPPLAVFTIPGLGPAQHSRIGMIRQYVAMLPLTVLLDRLRTPPPEEGPWEAY